MFDGLSLWKQETTDCCDLMETKKIDLFLSREPSRMKL